MGWSVLSQKPRQGWEAYLSSCMVGGEANKILRREVAACGIGADGNFYAAISEPRTSGGEIVERHVRGVVALVDGSAYKFIGEEEGPYYYACPAHVLAALTPTSEPFALKWRAKCAEAS